MTNTETSDGALYDWWSRHPRALGALYAIAFVGREAEIRRRAVETLDASADERVIEIGCGRGTGFERIEADVGENGRIVGLDASTGMVCASRARVLRQAWERVDVVRGDAREPPFPSGVFDAAYAAMALSAVPDPERAVEGAADVLRPGGRFVVLDARPFREWPWRLVNPAVVPTAEYATNWVPDVDVVATLRREFDDVDVTEFNAGSMFVARASLDDE